MKEIEKFIEELNEFINENVRLASNGDYVINVKWLREFIKIYK